MVSHVRLMGSWTGCCKGNILRHLVTVNVLLSIWAALKATSNASPENQCTQMSVRQCYKVVTTTIAEAQLRVRAPLEIVDDSNLELALLLPKRHCGAFIMVWTYKSINWNGCAPRLCTLSPLYYMFIPWTAYIRFVTRFVPPRRKRRRPYI